MIFLFFISDHLIFYWWWMKSMLWTSVPEKPMYPIIPWQKVSDRTGCVNPDGTRTCTVLKWKAKNSVCTRITQSRLDYRQRSDYRWLRLFRSMEQKQGPPFACLLFPCTQLELIVLHWKHKDRVECRLEDGLTKYKRSGLLERVGHVPFHPTSIRFRQLKIFSFVRKRKNT